MEIFEVYIERFWIVMFEVEYLFLISILDRILKKSGICFIDF